MTRDCPSCRESFTISRRDQEFYQRVEVPAPTLCPMCRQIRRHGHVNDYVYYSRCCDSCNKRFVATFPAQSGYRVICQSCWYSEGRDDKSSGRDYDFSRGFFEQFDQLMHSAPQMGNIAIRCENSDYCESIADCRNCYLTSECSNCEDSFYGYWIQKTVSSVDVAYLHECELCYETTDSFNCYDLKYSSCCRNCSSSYFLHNCTGCEHCLLSVNLRHKRYCIFNKQYEREEYFAKLKQMKLGSYAAVQGLVDKFRDLLATQPHKHLQMEMVENSWGDYLRSSKNCTHVWHCYDAEDCAYGEHVWRGAKDCMDVNTCGREAELIYESTNTNMGSYCCKFCRYCWGCRYVEYSNMCVGSSHLFGCVGLKPQNMYCILNKQYSKDEYEALLPKIKEKMLADGEYGEFFPLSISLFGYNNSVSFDDQRYHRGEVVAQGWKWEEASSGTFGKETVSLDRLSDEIGATDPAICNETFACRACSRNFKIIPQEFEFYRKGVIPLPRYCPDCRHRARLARRNSKRFRDAKCAKCCGDIVTTLDQKVYSKTLCGECYEREVV